MNMIKSIEMKQFNIQELYDQDLFNRYYLHKNVNYKIESSYGLKLFALGGVLFLKLIISKFLRKVSFSGEAIFISWSPLHTRRSKDLSENFKLLEFDRTSFTKKQLVFFSKVSIKDVINLFFKLRTSKVKNLKNSSAYIKDSFFYRFLFAVEFLALKGLIDDVEKVLIAGYNDRTSLIISRLCQDRDIHLSMLQHGVLGKKEKWKHLKADRFFYMYSFSKEYIQHQITVDHSTELIYLPKKTSSITLEIFKNPKFKKNIAYATSPADSEKDLIILRELKKELLKKECNLLIYPHPLEKEETYSEFKEKECVFVTRERHQNILFLISRYSTLGIDYYEQGITPVFLNFENHNIDFLNTDEFKIFENMMSFKTWIKLNV